MVILASSSEAFMKAQVLTVVKDIFCKKFLMRNG